ncbi:unnamed protein product [Phytophthora lilii]|uniref:Unnamed protein product n=1 Tax=Phytophthora lilii TaxID=2077276 RepID=A0A9W6U158_9STRA|nr:unnamed protein product [Phytophthora lilii]
MVAESCQGQQKARKSTMPLDLYKLISMTMLTSTSSELAFARAFMILLWNLESRPAQIASMSYRQLEWRENVLYVKFPNTGNGLSSRDPRRVYSNPADPAICPMLALGAFVETTLQPVLRFLVAEFALASLIYHMDSPGPFTRQPPTLSVPLVQRGADSELRSIVKTNEPGRDSQSAGASPHNSILTEISCRDKQFVSRQTIFEKKSLHVRQTCNKLKTHKMCSVIVCDDDAISVIAHQGSSQSSFARSANTRRGSRIASIRNSWRSTPSSVGNSHRNANWVTGGSRIDSGVRHSSESVNSVDGDTAPESTPGGQGANSFGSSSVDSTSPRKLPETRSTSTTRKIIEPPLYNSGILCIAPIGSGEENSATWSDTIGADDAADDYSIRNPHFDLTTA